MDELVLYDAKDLTTHALCVGMTGSGKTGLCVSLLEEAAIDGIPAICIDPKGDLGNLCLTFPNLQAADFQPWIDESEAKRKGRTVEEHAEAKAALWKKGLGEWGQDGQRIQRLQDAAEVAIYTPGSNAGRPINVLGSFQAPSDAILNDSEALNDRIQGAVSGLMALLGIEADPVQSREHILMSNILYSAWTEGESLALVDLIRTIQDPPFSQVGVIDLESFFPAKDRQKLAMGLNNLIASPGFSNWMQGEPLDVHKLLWTPEGKPRIAIVSIAHLDDQERMFVVTLLLNEVIAWMRSQSGTTSLRALLYMDEVFGFLPPVANPPSKAPMLTLLKQARAFGLGLTLATQNPVDIDYKALSNCGTWFLGRLQTEGDVERVLDGLSGASTSAGQSFDRGAMKETLAGLKSRVFLLNNVHDDAPVLFHTRWAMSYLRGPLTRKQIKTLSKSSATETTTAKTTLEEKPGRSEKSRPVVPPGVHEVFLGDGPGAYRPHFAGRVRLHHVNRASSLDQWEERVLLARVGDDALQVWEEAVVVDKDELEFFDVAPQDATFEEASGNLLGARPFKSLGKTLKSHAYQAFPRMVYRCKPLKLVSNAEETQAEFAARVQLAARERRDQNVEKLRKSFDGKLKRLQTRIDTAEDRLEREESQYGQQKFQTAVSVGSTILGAIFGRRVLGGAKTAARGAGRIAREKEDVSRAAEKVEDLKEQLETLQAEFEEAAAEIREDESLQSPSVDAVIVRPRKADIEVVELVLAWKPIQN